MHIPLFFIYASCILFLLAALLTLKRHSLFNLSLTCAVFLIGFLHLQNAQTYPSNHILNFVSDNPQKVYIRGKVASSPEVSQTAYHSQKTTFTFQAEDLRIRENWQTVTGLVKVNLYGQRQVQYADLLLLQGTLLRPPPLRNPGGFNYRAYLVNHKIFALLQVKEKDAFKLIASKKTFWLASYIFKFKQKLHRIIFRNLRTSQAALLSAILLGERSRLGQDVKDLFINTGTIHILATQYTKKHYHRAPRNLTL